jgi:UDP-N-acetylmuramyl pentapeptide phosphotransferase/UDP-N-acetylglucosamine-1-phosphate transferase
VSVLGRTLLAIGLAFGVAFVLTPVLRDWAKRRGLLDVPNDASSHTVPTPRNGGFAILAGILAGSSILLTTSDWKTIALIAAAALLPVTDEVMPISRKVRLVLQVCIAIGIVLLLDLGTRDVALTRSTTLSLGVVGVVLAVIWLVAIMNAYNFMDGLNGLSSTAAIVCGTSTAIVCAVQHDYAGAILAGVVAAAAAGFLPWNLPSGSVFMGDVGSTTLGLVLAILSLRLLSAGTPVLAAMIPLLSFCSDAFLAIIRRALKGERFFATRHRSHFYQWLNQQGWSHPRVTALWALLMATAGAAAVCVVRSPGPAAYFAVAVAFVVHATTFAWVAMRQRSA